MEHIVTQVIGEPGSDTRSCGGQTRWCHEKFAGIRCQCYQQAQSSLVHRYVSADNSVTLPLNLIQSQWWEECTFSLNASSQPRCCAFVCVSSSDRQWNILGLQVSVNFYIDLRAQSSTYQTLEAVLSFSRNPWKDWNTCLEGSGLVFFLTVQDLLSIAFILSSLKCNVKFHCKTLSYWEMPFIWIVLR